MADLDLLKERLEASGSFSFCSSLGIGNIRGGGASLMKEDERTFINTLNSMGRCCRIRKNLEKNLRKNCASEMEKVMTVKLFLRLAKGLCSIMERVSLTMN